MSLWLGCLELNNTSGADHVTCLLTRLNHTVQKLPQELLHTCPNAFMVFLLRYGLETASVWIGDKYAGGQMLHSHGILIRPCSMA